MKKALPWILGAVLAVVAGAITVATPSPDALRAPFAAHAVFAPDAEEQQSVTTRTLTATVVDATFSERVEVSDWRADGNWLVVTVAASAPRSEVDADVELATLHVGDEVFQASERVRDTLLDAQLRIGIDTVGMLAFELPANVRAGDAELRLTSSAFTRRLDGVIAITIPLDRLPTAPAFEITSPELAS